MKTLTAIALIGISTAVFSLSKSKCINLEIAVKNNTPYDCYLTQINLKHGYFLSLETALQTKLSLKIAPGATSSPLTFAEEYAHGPDVHLSYECGPERTITIESKQRLCRGKEGVYGQIITATAMDATYTTIVASYWSGTSGKISWILS
ncbi:MAG: hypothetical protein NXI01_06945 [Gammaproteobacteria bacterium]|nr:hypothetical protein [Gammaproteobacteria bacterium]